MGARDGAGRGGARPGRARQEQGKDHGPPERKRGTGQGRAWPGLAWRGRSMARIKDECEARDAAGLGRAGHGKSKARIKDRRNGREGRGPAGLGGAGLGAARHEQGKDHGQSEWTQGTGHG
jgi:hypothetical protein